jgi:hypothetical protein
MCGADPSLIAVATDAPLAGLTVPLFRLSDPGSIAEFIVERILGQRG